MNLWAWVGFSVFVVVMLALDLGVFRRKTRTVGIKEAAVWSIVWVALALLFDAGLYVWEGPEPATEFLAGYLIEKALSVDNIFVFVLIFSFFAVPYEYQHRVLFWGVLGALVMRAVFIAASASLLANFEWVIYVFGGFLVVTGVKMATQKEHALDLKENPAYRALRRVLPITDGDHGKRFFARIDGKLMATPLFVVLVVVEFSDLVFAIDSIPAIFAVTSDPFIVYTSNVFAILGLRFLYFVLAGAVGMFRFLKHGLAVILTFVGLKMLLAGVWHMPPGLSLAVILVVLVLSVAASLLLPLKNESGRNR